MGAQTAPIDRTLSDRQRSVAFATVLIAFVLEVADSTIVNTALPAIRESLGASPSAMQWIVAGYFLSLGSLLLLGGRLGDAFGYRRMFLIGVTAFVLSSALCGLAQTPTQLVVARLVQGGAGAIMGPQVMAIVQHLFSPLERGRQRRVARQRSRHEQQAARILVEAVHEACARQQRELGVTMQKRIL